MTHKVMESIHIKLQTVFYAKGANYDSENEFNYTNSLFF